MPRMLDIICPSCDKTWHDVFVSRVPDRIICECGAQAFVAIGTPSRQPWHERDSIVVFKDANGNIRYPGRNDTPTPSGYERVVMRSLLEVDKFEREHHVVNEAMHFDRNGRGMDDYFRGEKYD